MKARIPPQRKLNRQTLDVVDEYMRQKTHNELTRFLKIVVVVLNRFLDLATSGSVSLSRCLTAKWLNIKATLRCGSRLTKLLSTSLSFRSAVRITRSVRRRWSYQSERNNLQGLQAL